MDETALRKMAGKLKFSLASLEKDYMLTKILYEISKNELKDKVAFKGGTALNKVYFNYYRLSEDLDFTAVNVGADYIKKSIKNIAKESKIELKEENVTKYSYVAVFRFIGPLNHPNSINIDINTDEKLALLPVKKRVLHFYDIPSFEIQTMDIRELIAEKIRSLIQRKKPRDYYDVWFAIKRNNELSRGMKGLVNKKCGNLKVEMNLERIFTNLDPVEKLWKHHLVELVEKLPDFDKVIGELRTYLNMMT